MPGQMRPPGLAANRTRDRYNFMPRLLTVGLIRRRLGRRPFLLQERQDKDGRFVFSQRCFPGWLGPGAPLVCTPVPLVPEPLPTHVLELDPQISRRLGDV